MRRFHFWHRFCPAAWRPGFPHAHAGARRVAAFSSRPSGEHSARSGPWPRRPLGLPVPVPGRAGPSGGPSLASPAVSWTVPTPSSSSPSEVAVASLHLTPHLRGTSGSLRGPLPTLSRCRGPRGGTPWSPALPLGTGVTDTCPAVTLLPPSRRVGRHLGPGPPRAASPGAPGGPTSPLSPFGPEGPW